MRFLYKTTRLQSTPGYVWHCHPKGLCHFWNICFTFMFLLGLQIMLMKRIYCFTINALTLWIDNRFPWRQCSSCYILIWNFHWPVGHSSPLTLHLGNEFGAGAVGCDADQVPCWLLRTMPNSSICHSASGGSQHYRFRIWPHGTNFWEYK